MFWASHSLKRCFFFFSSTVRMGNDGGEIWLCRILQSAWWYPLGLHQEASSEDPREFLLKAYSASFAAKQWKVRRRATEFLPVQKGVWSGAAFARSTVGTVKLWLPSAVWPVYDCIILIASIHFWLHNSCKCILVHYNWLIFIGIHLNVHSLLWRVKYCCFRRIQ